MALRPHPRGWAQSMLILVPSHSRDQAFLAPKSQCSSGSRLDPISVNGRSRGPAKIMEPFPPELLIWEKQCLFCFASSNLVMLLRMRTRTVIRRRERALWLENQAHRTQQKGSRPQPGSSAAQAPGSPWPRVRAPPRPRLRAPCSRLAGWGAGQLSVLG